MGNQGLVLDANELGSSRSFPGQELRFMHCTTTKRVLIDISCVNLNLLRLPLLYVFGIASATFSVAYSNN